MGCGTLIGLALGVGGAVVKEDAASKEQDAMNQAVQQQLNQQNAFAKQGTNLFQNSLSQSTPQAMGQQQAAGAQQVLGASKAAALTPLALPSNQGIQDQVSSAGQQAKNSLAQQSNAQMQGYGNIGLSQYLKDLSTNSQLGVIGKQAQQSANVFPSVLQGAANSQGDLSALGSLLGTAGMLTGMGSASGLFGGAATAPTLAGVGLANNAGQLGQFGMMANNPLYMGLVAPQQWSPMMGGL